MEGGWSRLCDWCGREVTSTVRQVSWDSRIIITIVTAFTLLHISSGLHTTFPTFQPTISTFHDSETGHYRLLQLHPGSRQGYVYAGAQNYIIRMEMDNITRAQKSVSLKTQVEDRCKMKFNLENQTHYCENHIRVIVVEDNHVYACGTGANRPVDIYLDKSTLGVNNKTFGEKDSGIYKCPFIPDDYNTALYVTSGNPGDAHVLYTGTFKDERGIPVIYKTESVGRDGVSYNFVRSITDSPNWLNEPDFVASTERENYVFFFFREVALEHAVVGRAVYSRIARVCKHDLGGPTGFKHVWCTYLKVRLQCDLPGDLPFYFDEIQGVHHIGDTIYAVFTSNANYIYGSAVCAFDFDDVDSAFNGAYKEQLDAYPKLWVTTPDSSVPTPRPGNCTPGIKTEEMSPMVLEFLRGRPLMDEVVRPRDDKPMFYRTGTIYTQMQVAVETGYTIMYLATDHGEIHKVLYKPPVGNKESYARMLSIWEPFEDTKPILQLKYHHDTRQLYASTDTNIGQVDVRQCSHYTYCTHCVADPHCRWSRSGRSCISRSIGSVDSKNKWDSDPIEVCDEVCSTVDHGNQRVRLQGDTLVLPVTSNCALLDVDLITAPEWQFQAAGDSSWEKVELADRTRVTDDFSLVLLNVSSSDAGEYRFKYDSLVLDEHSVTVTECNNEECAWRQEFRQWCDAFQEYTTNFNHWKCMKQSCVDNNCVPEVSQCEADFRLPDQ